jgi:hypothetical protein
MITRIALLTPLFGACAALAACGSSDYTYATPPTTTVMVPTAPVVVPSTPVVVQPQTAYVAPGYVAPGYVAPGYVAPSTTYVLPTTPAYVAPTVASMPPPSGNSPITENKDVRRNAEGGSGM